MTKPVPIDLPPPVPAEFVYAIRALARSVTDAANADLLPASAGPIARWVGTVTDEMLGVQSAAGYRLDGERERERMVEFYGPAAGLPVNEERRD